MNNNRSSKTIILREGDEIISQPSAVADSFAKHFAQISNGKSADAEFQKIKSKSALIEIRFSEDNSDDYNREVTYKELQQAITSCNSKSTGPDSILFQFFKHFISDHINVLLRIFNFMYKTGVPDQWKESIIIPIIKPNKLATDLSLYRPIALTNCSCKIMKKIINWRLQNFLEKQNILSPYQSGFRTAHSTLDPLTRVESEVRESLMLDKCTMAVFLDISQTFDTVWHHGLLLKLLSIGLKGNLVRFVEDFIKQRQIKVKIRSALSESYQ